MIRRGVLEISPQRLHWTISNIILVSNLFRYRSISGRSLLVSWAGCDRETSGTTVVKSSGSTVWCKCRVLSWCSLLSGVDERFIRSFRISSAVKSSRNIFSSKTGWKVACRSLRRYTKNNFICLGAVPLIIASLSDHWKLLSIKLWSVSGHGHHG